MKTVLSSGTMAWILAQGPDMTTTILYTTTMASTLGLHMTTMETAQGLHMTTPVRHLALRTKIMIKTFK